MPSSFIFISSVRDGGDDEAGLVVGERDAAGVEDRAAHGGLDDLLDVVALRLVGVLLAVADLEVPEPAAEGAAAGRRRGPG